jgi:hypothetical protein
VQYGASMSGAGRPGQREKCARLLRRLCSHICDPPHSLHTLFLRLWGQTTDPRHSCMSQEAHREVQACCRHLLAAAGLFANSSSLAWPFDFGWSVSSLKGHMGCRALHLRSASTIWDCVALINRFKSGVVRSRAYLTAVIGPFDHHCFTLAIAGSSKRVQPLCWVYWYRLVSNHEDERHRTTPPEKMALEATKPEATKDPWVRTGAHAFAD